MSYDEKYRLTSDTPHNVVMEGRSRVSVTGVSDVESFDENEIVVNTSMGVMFLRGSNLHIGKLSLDSGDLVIDGTIDCVEYEEGGKASGGFFSRMFR